MSNYPGISPAMYYKRWKKQTRNYGGI